MFLGLALTFCCCNASSCHKLVYIDRITRKCSKNFDLYLRQVVFNGNYKMDSHVRQNQLIPMFYLLIV